MHSVLVLVELRRSGKPKQLLRSHLAVLAFETTYVSQLLVRNTGVVLEYGMKPLRCKEMFFCFYKPTTVTGLRKM